MWTRSAVLSLIRRASSKEPHHVSSLQKSCRPSIYHATARCQSSSSASSSSSSSSTVSLPKSMEEAQTLEEIYESIEEQSQLDDKRRTLENPTPFFSLLHYPSRASWRSSDHILGEPPSSNTHVHSLLGQTQFNIIQHSERTNKQLKRTYKRIIETHKLLAVKRERERRLAANLSTSPTNNNSKLNDNSTEDSDGTIQDGRGRHVGDWIDKKNKKKRSRYDVLSASETLCDDPSVALSLSMGLSGSRNLAADYDTTTSNNINNPDASSMMNGLVMSAKSANKLAKSKDMSTSSSSTSNNNERPVGYSAEQTLTNLRYRFGPNYSIVKRVLSEVQSLLGGDKSPPLVGSSSPKHVPFRPKRVLDFGCGVGSSSAAALDVFGVCRNENTGATTSNSTGIEWIHSIDASKSMRDATERVLSSVLQASPWQEEGDDSDSFLKTEEDRLLDEELIKYEKEIGQLLKGGGHIDMKRLERQRKRLAKWEHTWTKQSNARTRLTFGESIVDASSFYSDQIDEYKEDRPALPWQAKLDEQRRLINEKKKKKKDDTAKPSSSNQKKKQGSFDLILCSYTLSELPNVPSSLAASTLLWEKLAPNGILVFVEPGTPDGFGILRSVRSMLLECCPPPEIKDKRRRRREAAAAEAAAAMKEAHEKEEIERESGDSSESEDGEDVTSPSTPEEEDHDNWPEECHVIAPCTHNGSCPMSRHQRNHVKRNTRFGKYEAAAEPNEVEEDENGEVRRDDSGREEEEEEDGDMNIQDLLSNWDYMTQSDKDELKMMMGGDDDMSDDEAKAMLEYMESMEGGSDSDEDEDDGDDSDSDDDVDEQEYYNIDQDTTSTESSNNKESSTMKQTDVFDTSFCSFVHKFPGGTSRKKGEKFTYLVLQKRVPGSNDNTSVLNPMKSEDESLLDEIDVAELMSNSVHHGQELKKEELRKRLQQKRRMDMNTNGDSTEEDPDVYDTYHQSQYFDILKKAVEVEDAFLDSNLDSLGLEMLRGDDRRKGWGRLIRAPLKRKGHVLIDYCSAGCGGCSKNIPNDDDEDDWFEERRELPDGTQGRITRQKVSRGWSARSAPGCYSAARRARWGGLWPDLTRVKLDEIRQKKERKLKNDW